MITQVSESHLHKRRLICATYCNQICANK